MALAHRSPPISLNATFMTKEDPNRLAVEKLLEIARMLEDASDESQAISRLSGGKTTTTLLWMTANRDALLNFAAGFLRAAASPVSDEECCGESVDFEHDQIEEHDYLSLIHI